MSLESVFKLSLIMNMVDNLTSPLSRVSAGVDNSVSRLQGFEQTLGGMTKGGMIMAEVGQQIMGAALAPVEATFDTRRAIGELSSLGVEDLGLLEDAARSFSDTWAGTTKAEFITAAYDIKSGIASLTDEGIAGYTEIAGLTAKATKASIGEMTNLFATGYGIYKGYYDDLSDIEFAEMFSAGISESVRAFKTSGSGMAQAIQTLGASATNANVPLEEQLAIVGMLQATMGGSEAGTKYNAFLRSAVKGGKELGLSFTDTNNQLLSLPEILELLRGKFGDTIDAAEKLQIQKAFGDSESVKFIDLLYNKTGELQDSILGLYGSMGEGIGVADRMASAINDMEPDQWQVLQQQIQNIKESIGNTLLPTVNELFSKGRDGLAVVSDWVQDNQELVRVIMIVALALGGILTVGGTVIAVVGGIGLIFTKTAGFVGGFIGTIKKLPGMLDTVRLYGMYAGDGIRKGFSVVKGAGASAISSVRSVTSSIAAMAKTAAVNGVNSAKSFAISVGTTAKAAAISGATAVKSFAVGMVGMAKQAVVTAASAMPGLIASVWSFTAALLANPITWVVIAVIALIAGLVLLYNKCEWFRNAVNAVWGAIKSGVTAVWNTIKNIFGGMMTAYQEHGGGLKGIAAAAMAGIKGIYSAGWNALDNLTGGKLTAIKEKAGEILGGMKAAYEEHGGGIRGVAAAALNGMQSLYATGYSALNQITGGKLDDMRAAYEQHGGGIRGVAAAALTGVRSIYEGGFNLLDNLTGGKLSGIRDKVSEGIENMKNAVTEKFQAFRDSGRKLIETFTEGIKAALAAPVEAIKGGLAKVRELLPFSDAKAGPLSTLTLSGTRTMSTLAEGIQQGANLPAEAVTDSLSRVNPVIPIDPAPGSNVLRFPAPEPDPIPQPPPGPAPAPIPFPVPVPVSAPAMVPEDDGPDADIRATRPPVRTIERRELREERTETETTISEKESGVRIGSLTINVKFDKIEKLPLLFKLLEEVEDYANSNGLAFDAEVAG